MNTEKTVVVLLIEKSQSLKMYLGDLMEDYIKPMITYFSGGVCEENDVYFTQTALVKYCTIFFGSELSMLQSWNQLKSIGPTTSHKKVLKDINDESYSYKNADRQAHIMEGMQAAVNIFKELSSEDEASNPIKRCLVLITQSVPMSNPWTSSLNETIFQDLKELKVKTSVISAHKIRDLYKLYEKAGGDLQAAAHKNYATKPQHLVLLNGVSLPERAISPSLMPQTIVTNAPVGAVMPQRGGHFVTTNSPAHCGSPLTTQQQQHQQQQQTQLQNPQQLQPGMMNPNQQNVMMGNVNNMNQRNDWQMGGMVQQQQNQAGGMQPMIQQVGQPQMIQGNDQNMMVAQMNRTQPVIWHGSLDWTEEKQGHGGGTKVYRLPCKMTQLLAKSGITVKTVGWPATLHMFFAPKTVLGFITNNNLLENSTKVNFIPEPCPALDNLTAALSDNVGVVQLSSENTEVKMILLVLSNQKRAFVGFIPTEQAAFVGKMSQMFNLNRQRNPGMPQGNFKMNPAMMQQQQQPGGVGQASGVPNQMMTQGMPINQQNIAIQNQMPQQMNPGMAPNSMVGMGQMTGINPNQNMVMVPGGQIGMTHMQQGGQVPHNPSVMSNQQLMRPSMTISHQQQQPTDQINVRQAMQQQQGNIRQMQRPIQMMNTPRVMQNQAQSQQGFRQMLQQRLQHQHQQQQQQQQQQQLMMLQQQQQQQQGMRQQMAQPQQVMTQQTMGQQGMSAQPMPQQGMSAQAMNQQQTMGQQQAMGQPQQAMGQPQQAMGQPQQAMGQPQQAMGQPLQDDTTDYLGML